MKRSTAPKRILICEDEPLLRELMRVALVGDYEFEEVASLAEAIAVSDRFRPDLALVDVMVPGGSGLDLVRHLARERDLCHARCVVISAFASDADRHAATAAGAHAFLSKPFDPDDLSATVTNLLKDES